LRRGAAGHRFAATDGQAQGGDAGELEARRRRDHRRLGHRRGRQEAISAGLEGAKTLHAHRAAATKLGRYFTKVAPLQNPEDSRSERKRTPAIRRAPKEASSTVPPRRKTGPKQKKSRTPTSTRWREEQSRPVITRAIEDENQEISMKKDVTDPKSTK